MITVCWLHQIYSSMQHLYTAALLCFALTRFILRLATFSLERLKCCTVSRSSQLLVYHLGFGPSLFLSLFEPIQQGLFKLGEAFLSWCQCPRPSVPPADMHLYSIIGACQWGSFFASGLSYQFKLRHPFFLYWM